MASGKRSKDNSCGSGATSRDVDDVRMLVLLGDWRAECGGGAVGRGQDDVVHIFSNNKLCIMQLDRQNQVQ